MKRIDCNCQSPHTSPLSLAIVASEVFSSTLSRKDPFGQWTYCLEQATENELLKQNTYIVYSRNSRENSLWTFGLWFSPFQCTSLLFSLFNPFRSFIHGVFFSFNTITTIGLGNIQVKSNVYLAVSRDILVQGAEKLESFKDRKIFENIGNFPLQLAVFYVVIGLAVITASLDLCSSTLKRTFTKLHYFGRKIRGARRVSY